MLRSTLDGSERQIRARAVVNAAGPWVSRLLDGNRGFGDRHTVHLVKGSHIVVPRLFDHDYAYILQHTDRRIVFAIPYERDFTLIGTTDVAYQGNPADAETSPEEIEYLCSAVNHYLEKPIGADDVVATYAGVRPLYDESGTGNASAMSRDYSLDLDTDQAPLLTVLGGKLTTYRKLALEACERLAPLLGGTPGDWTGTAALPGGDFPAGDFTALLSGLCRRCPWLPQAMAWRLARNYGRLAEEVVVGAESLDDLGRHFGADLYETEVRYLMDREWAMTADDILWRRSKLGLRLNAQERAGLEQWIRDRDCEPVSETAGS